MVTETVRTSIAMTDGRIVEFTTKQKMVKTTTISDAGEVSIQLDFRNGAVRHFTIPSAMLLQFAGHGAEQKLGDAAAGEETIEDGVEAIDDLIARLNTGDWLAKRQSGAFAGQSVLIQALVEASGKQVDEIRAFLATKDHKEKLALRKAAKIAPIIARLEAAKPKKASNVDTDSMLAGLGLSDPSENTADPTAETPATSRKR